MDNAGTPEERRSGIGGSDAAAALGLSPWQTQYELWEQKIGLAPPTEQTEPMLWGKLLEDIVRDEYARRTGLEVRPVMELIRHRDHPWMFAHVDGKVGPTERVILEVKTSRTAQGWGQEETDQIPLYYLTQVHHYLAVTEAEVCDVAVLFGGQDFRLYQVIRDQEIEQSLIEGEAIFWDLVQKRRPPEPVSVQDAVRRWGHIKAAGSIVAGAAEIDAVERLRQLHRQQKEIERAEEETKLALMSVMGDDGLNLVSPDGELLVTWALDNGRKGYTVAAKEPSRRFLVKYLEEA